MIYNTVPSPVIINQAVAALTAHGITAEVVATKDEAKVAVLKLIVKGSEVMTMSSETLSQTGIAPAINESPDYISVRAKLMEMNRETDGRQMQVLGAAPTVAVGSAQAVTAKGELVFASNTGSQLPAYAYGSDQVIIVVGAQKIVPTLDEAMKRVYEYVLPLESERAHKAYGVPGSNVSKLLVVSKEIKPNRIHVVIVKEVLGF
jgi:L-lactate utilization protein LutC